MKKWSNHTERLKSKRLFRFKVSRELTDPRQLVIRNVRQSVFSSEPHGTDDHRRHHHVEPLLNVEKVRCR